MSKKKGKEIYREFLKWVDKQKGIPGEDDIFSSIFYNDCSPGDIKDICSEAFEVGYEKAIEWMESRRCENCKWSRVEDAWFYACDNKNNSLNKIGFSKVPKDFYCKFFESKEGKEVESKDSPEEVKE